MTIKAFAVDALERAGATFVQTLVVVLFAAGVSVLGNPDWLAALLAGAIAAAVSVLTSLASVRLPVLAPLPELGMRVGKTFLQSFVGALSVAGYIHVNWAGALAVALPVALLALVKGLTAMSVPGTASGASLLPAAPGSAPSHAAAP